MACLKILAVLALIAFAKAQQNPIENILGNLTSLRNEEYISAHRRLYAFNIWLYGLEINAFKDSFLARVDAVEFQKDALLGEIIMANEKWEPLSAKSNVTKDCVEQNSDTMPTKQWAEKKFDKCISHAKSRINRLIMPLQVTNFTLAHHYSHVFEKDVTRCENKFNETMLKNQTVCLNKAVADANAYTAKNQNTFSKQMESAKNSSTIDIQNLHECIFDVHNATLTKISETNHNIESCIRGAVDCSKCSGHFCVDVYPMASSSIDFESTTMNNPFYGRNDTSGCLILNIF
ncbi:uncharacterized protein LOC106086058 [Stomoxys calcitrans]|uniref:Protein TsetseEP domain-containing protein n=1 Tax=Stomoxys calcitrans TaxID=35570 RepID=A0A1I8PED0_STOCA|nr:uncharacterized protein LOC106086058 [Stomoxys calcitrans]